MSLMGEPESMRSFVGRTLWHGRVGRHWTAYLVWMPARRICAYADGTARYVIVGPLSLIAHRDLEF